MTQLAFIAGALFLVTLAIYFGARRYYRNSERLARHTFTGNRMSDAQRYDFSNQD